MSRGNLLLVLNALGGLSLLLGIYGPRDWQLHLLIASVLLLTPYTISDLRRRLRRTPRPVEPVARAVPPPPPLRASDELAGLRRALRREMQAGYYDTAASGGLLRYVTSIAHRVDTYGTPDERRQVSAVCYCLSSYQWLSLAERRHRVRRALELLGPSDELAEAQAEARAADERKAATAERRRLSEAEKARRLDMKDVDSMTGVQFERYVARLLIHQGFQDVKLTSASGDQGVDITAARGAVKFAVQTKRQAAPVSRQAVSDAVAGKALHGCTAAVVITNGRFGDGAKQLARANDCLLVDGGTLAHWIDAFRLSEALPTDPEPLEPERARPTHARWRTRR
jgi:hypothetical protein